MNFWTYLKDFTRVLYLLFSVLWFDDLTESIGPFDKKNTLELAENATTKVILKMQPTWKNIDFFWTQRKKIIVLPGYFTGLHHFQVMVVVHALNTMMLF